MEKLENVIEFNGEKYLLQGCEWEEEYVYGKRIVQLATQGQEESMKIYHVFWVNSKAETPEDIIELKRHLIK